jgi:hypothetical protein
MTADELRANIEDEINGRWTTTNAHGCDLRRCLVSPKKQQYRDCSQGDSGKFVELWLVLEEDPISQDGYKIVYDERSGYFGLATPGEGTMVPGDPKIDVYSIPTGSFWSAFGSM